LHKLAAEQQENLVDTTELIIPDFYLPFEVRENPNASEVREPLLAWLRETGVLDASAADMVDSYALHRLAGMMYPDGDAARLGVYAAFLGWIFAIDDLFDQWTERPKVASFVVRRLYAVQADAHPHEGDHVIVHAYRDLRRRLSMCARSSTQVHAFDAAIADFLEASAWELENRRLGRLPGLVEYLQMGVSTVGVYPCVAALAILEGRGLPPLGGVHSRIARMMQAAALATRVTNDVLSLSREAQGREVNNLVLILMDERHIGANAACRDAARYADELVRLFLEQAGSLPAANRRDESDVSLIVTRLEAILRASHDWGRSITSRYATAELAIDNGRARSIA
jgi:germacradienol/geosmin synthase